MEDIELLNQKCSALGIEAGELQLQKILQWVGLLQKWNQAYNLTALNNTNKIIDYLVIASIAAIPYLQGKSVLDVGSGSGVPGIPLAIFAPHYQYTLIDSNSKKIRFLEHCQMFIELSNIEIKQARIENFAPSVKFDTIVSRALSNLGHFISASLHLGHKQTHWLAFKGKISKQELDKLHDIEVDSGLCHSVKRVNATAEQNLVLVRY